MTLRTLNYGNCGIFLIMGNAGFMSSTVAVPARPLEGAMAEASANTEALANLEQVPSLR